MTMDIKNFYLMTPMDRYEYMRMPLKLIPARIIEHYNLRDIATEDGWVYIEIRQGMYGLRAAGKLANDLLQKRLHAKGFYQCQFTPGLWRHKWRPITFSLVVDDFGVKFVGEHHATYLKEVLEEFYEVTEDWTGGLFCGISLKWDYDNGHVDIHMPGYIHKALTRFDHPMPKRPQHAPAKAEPIQYGAKVQTTVNDDSAPLSKEKIKYLQEVIGTLLYYARGCDPMLAQSISSIGSRQANGTEAVMQECRQLLDYCATHPNSGVRFVASDMILNAHSDASYLSEPGSKSRAGGHFFLGKKGDRKFNNGALLTLSSLIKHVVASATEAELAALFYNCRAAIPLRVTLQEMGHPQPRTPITTDNSAAHGLIHQHMAPKAAKAMDMRFNWLKSPDTQRQFDIGWEEGAKNRADLHTKKHPVHTYVERRPDYNVDVEPS